MLKIVKIDKDLDQLQTVKNILKLNSVTIELNYSPNKSFATSIDVDTLGLNNLTDEGYLDFFQNIFSEIFEELKPKELEMLVMLPRGNSLTFKQIQKRILN